MPTRLTIIEDLGRFKIKNTTTRWVRVRCTCGTIKVMQESSVRDSRNVSCGCYGRELLKSGVLGKKHGMTYAREYKVYKDMLGRCRNPTHPSYYLYGERGIQVHPDWENDFLAFYAELGNRPSPSHSLERRDNSKGYEPGNCYWATSAEQSRNKRSNRKFTINDETLVLTDWCARYGTNMGTVHYRLKQGLTIEEALTVPPNKVRSIILAKKVASGTPNPATRE